MSIFIAGMGWVTPLGADLDAVWTRLMRGDVAEGTELRNPETGRLHHFASVPSGLVAHLGREPRLRRASPISYYAVAAGLAAIAQAGLSISPEVAAQMAVIFAVSSGSVVYTRKFYEGIVKKGADAASPLLFPETVYNAPASHLAAQLGLDGITYTVVGDSSVGLTALKLAEQLLLGGDALFCLVVGAEEVDWVLCDAYRDWRFTADATSNEEGVPWSGALLAEGAGALLLTREPTELALQTIHDGASFGNRAEAKEAMQRVTAELAAGLLADCVIGSANGSWTDSAEAQALATHQLTAPLFCPKLQMGEALGASALWQVIAAALALQTGHLPGGWALGDSTLSASSSPSCDLRTALVLSTGLNQQASGLIVRKAANR